MSNRMERVKIWNTFFKLAWSEAKSLYENLSGSRIPKEFHPCGGTLVEQEFHTLATLVLCTLAIEARANHLIEELLEEGRISRDVAEAARQLSPKHKWFLLPKLAGIAKPLVSNKGPHQSVAQICTLRNDLLHVSYARLKKRLPKPKTALKLFQGFVDAMEDMNVVLGWFDKKREDVVKIGRFP
jgi:hypothetical protein